MTVPMKRLSEIYDVDMFFYNPNIHPEPEYRMRAKEIALLGERWNFRVEEGPYDAEDWFIRTRGLENEPERGTRCSICYEMRLEATARMASEGGYDGFTTTLTLSPLKDAHVINTIGERIGKLFGILFIHSDFKKKDGFRESVDLSRQEALYRQDYCGCVYSKRQRENVSNQTEPPRDSGLR
jgi:predicted adenine nucleotide alpha hydrolase (AANH) superfamily ATPase